MTFLFRMGDVDWPVVGKLDGYLRGGISLDQCDVHMAYNQERFETLISRVVLKGANLELITVHEN